MRQIYSQRIPQTLFFRDTKKLVWDKEELNKGDSQEESQEIIQDEKSTGRMLKSKSDQDRQTDRRYEI